MMSRTYKQLLEIFRSLGAPNPEGMARSESEEDVPRLAKFVFLRQAWKKGVIPDGDVAWMEEPRKFAKQSPKGPTAGIGLALERLLSQGADPKDISEVVRGMQYRTLNSVCYLLSDPSIAEAQISDVSWTLCEVDSEGQPIRPMQDLHEEVLMMDPTGRGMRPGKSRS